MKTLLFLIPIALGLLWKSCQEEVPLKNACSGCQADSTRIEADMLSVTPFFENTAELAFLSKKYLYNPSFLLDNQLVSSKDESKKALLYGAYLADITLLYLLDEKKELPTYFNTLQLLHQDLGMTYPIDFKHLENSKENNLDSLLKQIYTHFNHLTCCLARQNREHISDLILFGAWLEQMNYLCLLYEKYPDWTLKDKIGESRLSIEQLDMVTTLRSQKSLHLPYIKNLKEKFSKVNIILYCFKKHNVIENEQGELILLDEPSPSISISDPDFLAIRQEIKRLRGELLY